MQYTPHANWLKLLILVVPVTAWGLWPLFRTLNGAPVLLFARINILSEFSTACVYALIFEGPNRIWKTFASADLRVGFAVLGGFFLGHGDHCSAIPMPYHEPGTTIALVGTLSLVLTCVFNYIQVGANRPDYVFTGLSFALLALVFLSQTVENSNGKELKQEMRLAKTKKEGVFFNSGCDPLIQNKRDGEFTEKFINPKAPINISESTKSGLFTATGSDFLRAGYANEAYTVNPPPQLTMSKRKGLAIMSVAGLFTACWGPMSTYARNGSSGELVRSPGLMLFFFTLGEVLALPDLYLICLCIEPQPEYTLTWRRLLWGIGNGFAVATGYFFFFISTYNKMDDIVVPATVIVNCSPLVAVITDIVRGKFTGAPTKTKVLLTSAVTLYFNAVLMNSFSV